MCIDLVPKGQIDSYFEFNEADHEQYVMFQEDPKETEEELVKQIGALLLEQSEFLKNYEIEKHHMTTMPAGFYDDIITFGEMTLKSREDEDLFYFYVVDELDINMMSTDKEFTGNSFTNIEESKADVFDQKRLYTAFFINGTAFLKSINDT